MTARTSERPAFHPGVRRSPYFEETERAGAREYLIYNHMYMPADYGHVGEEDYVALTTAVTPGMSGPSGRSSCPVLTHCGLPPTTW